MRELISSAEQNDHYFLEDKCIFMNEIVCNSIQMSLKCIPNRQKPSLEPKLTQFTGAFMRHYGETS